MKKYNFQQLSHVLDSGAPMLMLDMAQLSDDGNSAVGRKVVSMSEGVFQGHFPGQPILPGVLQVAAMTQLSRLIFKETLQDMGGTEIVLSHIKRVKFRKPVLPGMVVTVESKLLDRNVDGDVEFQVSCTTEQGLASAGTLILSRVNSSDFDRPRNLTAARPNPFAETIASMQAFDSVQMMQALPHRVPFLLIDRGYGIGGESPDIYGYKNLSGNDMMLSGSSGVYPFPLMIEAGAQLGCAHILSKPGNAGKLGIFLCIDEAHFYSHAMIGDQLVIHAQCDGCGRASSATGEMWVEDMKIADCKLKFIIMDALN